MATPTAPVLPPQTRHPIGRVAAIILGITVLIALGTLAWLYRIAHSALPQLDGTVQVRGLLAPVTVTRDTHGVPTIEAANFDDLFFAQGYVTAQDRLWQMDVMRRYAAGELSEILGGDLLAHDREQRILGMRESAQKTIEAASEQDRSRFEAYARGVNAYIESQSDHLPLEFRILGYSPEPWKAQDSALIAAQMVKDLNHGTYKTVLARENILARLGPELTADLYVNSSRHDRLPTESHTAPSKQSDQDDEEVPDSRDSIVRKDFMLPAVARLNEDLEPRLLAGSNNWVISGAHTVSGKPLLSNDMHLGHQMPNLWYEAHLECGDFDVAGVTLPGLPYVIVGHNQRIAWGFTNVGPTVEDVYVETFNANGQYLTPQGWKDPAHRREKIRIKNQSDMLVDVVITRHGPIINELVAGETRKLALRWTLFEGARNPFFKVDSAQNWEQFRGAFSEFDAPGQNVVYADVDGNIGHQATGRVPIRATGDGSLPEDGSNDSHEWIGYIPFEKLPYIYNPATGIIATANSRITPEQYPYSISTEWQAPWRSERIYRVLESGKKFSTADMLALQTDIYSELDHFAAERFVQGVDHAKNPSARAKQAAGIMRGWNGRMSADSAAPALEYRARAELSRLLLEAKLGRNSGGTSYRWGMQSVWLENILRDQPQRWLPDKYANYDELFCAAVEAAVTGPDTRPDLNSWKWGKFNAVEIQHPIFGRVPVLNRWTGPGIKGQSGSGYAVKAVTPTHGPSERMTVDLADLDASTLNLVTGQSGNFLSPYYMDQWKAWYEGFTFRLPFSPQGVESSRQHRLMLAPADQP